MASYTIKEADKIKHKIIYGYFMAVLVLARIPWDRWLHFMLSLFLIESLLGSAFLVIA